MITQKRNQIATVLALALASAGLTLPADAQGGKDPAKTQQQAKPSQAKGQKRAHSQQSAAKAKERSQKQRQVSGTVLRTKSVTIKDTGKKNTVVLLKTKKQGRQLVVDLGDEKKAQDLKVKMGDQVAAQGVVMNVGNRQVFVASRAKGNGVVVQLDQPEKKKKG